MVYKPVWDPKEVRKAVLRETVQHPVTLFFGASSIISSLYIALISGSKPGLLVALSSMGLAVGSWIFNYFFRLDHFVEQHYEKWKKQVDQERKKRLAGLRQQLVDLNFAPGLEAFDDLQSAYERFISFLHQGTTDGLTQLQRVRMEGIAGETYDLGMKIMVKLVSLVHIVQTIDVKKFQTEVRDLADTIVNLTGNQEVSPDSHQRLENLKKRKAAIQTRIDSYNKAMLEIEGLLTRAEECENSIENSILQMPVLSDKIDDQQLQQALSNMEMTVNAARRVSEKLQNLESESGEHPDDDIYLQTGRR